MKKESIIIMGFPGMGKTYAKEHEEELCLDIQDSDSSNFHWLIEEETGKKVLHPAWPKNYMDYIELTGREQSFVPDFIMCSTHDEVIRGVLDLNFRTVLVFVPTRSDKKYWLDVYKKRGSSDEFIDMMDKNFYKFISDVYHNTIKHDGTRCFVLSVGPNLACDNIYEFLKWYNEHMHDCNYR